MSFRKSTGLLAAVATLALTVSAQASIRTLSVGDIVTIRYAGFDYRAGTGGEFELGKVNNPGANARYFHTFCAENGEHLGGSNQQYYVQSLSLVSKDQGGTLTSASARLYRDYYNAMANRGFGYQSVNGSGNQVAGVSTAFTLGGGANSMSFRVDGTAAERAASGQSVQKALWKMLGYGGTLTGDALKLYTYYTTNYDKVGGAQGYFGVRLANLVYANHHDWRTQDQFAVIPEPGSLLIWGVAGLGCALVAGRRRRASH